MFIAVIGLVQGPWFLGHHHHWILTEIPVGYLKAALNHKDFMGSLSHDHHERHQILDQVVLMVG